MISEDIPLKLLGQQYFTEIFEDDGSTNIVDKLKGISLFPCFSQEMDKESFLKPISLSEVEVVLKGFKKEKHPGPDGWLVAFFLAFFDLVGDDLCNVVA